MGALFATRSPDPYAQFFQTGFDRFTTKHGIDGLCKVTDYELELLAVFAAQPGTGQFSRFMAHAKEKFDRIRIWEIWNPDLEIILKHYGFTPCVMTEDTGEILTGMEWNQARTACIKHEPLPRRH